MRKPKTILLWAALAAAALAGTAAVAQQPAPAPTKVIGFMTDFDVKDDAVGICKAVMESVAPGRSEERRVGKECTEQCRSRWSPYH